METLYEKRDDKIGILSPAVGHIACLPVPGRVVSAGSVAGTIEILGTTYLLYLPPGIEGTVADIADEHRVRAVAYGEHLFSLTAIEAQKTKAMVSADSAGTTQGQYELTALSQGIFYRRASPDSPPYVDVGSVVRIGQVLALIEVMKCFNQVIYAGAALPQAAKVVAICAKDGAEVQYQQTLFRFIACT